MAFIKFFNMILSSLKYAGRVKTLHPLFEKLFEYVATHNLLDSELGKIVIDDDRLFINNINPECVLELSQKLEVHREYIDVHILLEGKERIGWKDIDSLTSCVQTYNSETDSALYQDVPTTYVDLLPGQFAIVYPEDAHAPLIGNGRIRKLVAKVKI